MTLAYVAGIRCNRQIAESRIEESIGPHKWDEQVFRIGEAISHEEANAAPHPGSPIQTVFQLSRRWQARRSALPRAVLRMAMAVATFGCADADELRRAVGMRRSWERMKTLEGRLRAGMTANGVDTKTQERVISR